MLATHARLAPISPFGRDQMPISIEISRFGLELGGPKKKVAKKGASYRRLRRLLRHLYIVDAVLEASGRQALLL